MKNHKTIATHNGSFHADDIFGVAVVRRIFPENTLIRTRDRDVIEAADFVIDVGGLWDPATGRFDHHQRGFIGARPPYEDKGVMMPGVGYASAGLVWREFGVAYVEKLAQAKNIEIDKSMAVEITAATDRAFVRFLDMVDTGKGKFSPGVYGFSELISQLNTTWMEEQAVDAVQKVRLQYDRFIEAVRITTVFLDQMILRKLAQLSAMDLVRRSEQLFNGKVLHLKDGGMPWTRVVVEELPDILFVIYPDSDSKQYQVHTVPTEIGSFIARLDLPASWAGLRDEEMAAETGVPDSVFCHMNLFIGGAGSYEGAIRLTELALNARVQN